MLLAPLPFDYATLLDPGDRVRRTRARTQDRRGRPVPPAARERR
jgi:hypothetical protein